MNIVDKLKLILNTREVEPGKISKDNYEDLKNILTQEDEDGMYSTVSIGELVDNKFDFMVSDKTWTLTVV